MKRLMFGLLAATGAASGAAFAANPANPTDDTGSVYIDGLAQYTLLDHRRESKDDFGYQLGIGDNIAPNFALEFNYEDGAFQLKG
ncbi:MAG TPA: hypothetical protein VMU40_12860, partial [Steroidobacteraceae bacterium]|nr:hypothetical protein [Steroidobacteraceae bacterium]